VIRREGASIRVEQASEIVRQASLKPIEGSRKVLVLDEFHLVADATAGKLLKTIEEPPGGTVFVVLADDLPDELVTIASRCVQVEFPALTAAAVAEVLVAEGLAPDAAAQVAEAAHGDLDRARLLASDERVAPPPGRLGRHPGPARRHRRHRRRDRGRAAGRDRRRRRPAPGPAGAGGRRPQRAHRALRPAGLGGRGVLDERHKRQLRRLRTDELRMGLAELAHAYRGVVVGDPGAPAGISVDDAAAALDRIWLTIDALVRNPHRGAAAPGPAPRPPYGKVTSSRTRRSSTSSGTGSVNR
jgi:DNA polymerase-3 subunit delta'